MSALNETGSRLNQYIASCGICSRREADRMIEAGRVSVNGTEAVPGMRIKSTDEVRVDGNIIVPEDNKI